MAKYYNDVECFMYYMYNIWNLTESKRLFGNDLGLHIYNKWIGKLEYSHDQTMSWYGDLDKGCRDKILERAKELYDK